MKIRQGQLYTNTVDGDVCTIVAVATHAINDKSYVIYQTNGRVLTMPTKLFKSSVTVNGQKVPKFKLTRECN